MKMIFAAVALSIAVPAMAQPAPASAKVEAKKECCCEKMKAKMACCKDKAAGDKSHAGHDMKPAADAHANH